MIFHLEIRDDLIQVLEEYQCNLFVKEQTRLSTEEMLIKFIEDYIENVIEPIQGDGYPTAEESTEAMEIVEPIIEEPTGAEA